jgi:hypothetical protein
MGILNFWGKGKKEPAPAPTPATHVSKEITDMLDSLIKEARSGIQYDYWLPNINTLKGIAELKKKEPAFIDQFSRYAVEQIDKRKNSLSAILKKKLSDKLEDWQVILKIAGHVLKFIPPPDEATVLFYIHTYLAVREPNMHYSDIPYNNLLDMAETFIKENGFTPAIAEVLPLLKRENHYYSVSDVIKANEKVDFLLQGNTALVFNKHDVWGAALDTFFQQLEGEERAAWIALFQHCSDQADKNAPSQQWSKKTPALLDKVGKEAFARQLITWLTQVRDLLREIHKTEEKIDFLRESNHDLLRSLIWCAGFVNHPELNSVLDDYAVWAYKKKTWVGAVSARTGTACMYAFSLLPFKDGVSKLTKFRMKIKNNTILKSIDKIIKEVSKKSGITPEEMEEMGVPDFGLDQEGAFRTSFDDCTAIYTIHRLNDTTLQWEKDGKPQKSIPATVKDNHAAGLKTLKALIKEIESMLPVYKDRLEQAYLKQKTWTLEEWKTGYLLHPLMRVLTKKLIWHFAEGELKTQGIWLNDQLVDAAGTPLPALSENTTVQLWHPIGFPVETVVAWREFMQQQEITQPFKQAYREVYLVTDAELRTDTYSNRFAAHILRQHQFNALCKQRNWKYSVMGQWDSYNTPVVYLPAWNMMAEFYVEANWDEVANDLGVYNYIQTDQVRFHRDGRQLQMHEVPAIVFTEIMRDVDMFVGVTSIGNDPNWQDGGDARGNIYWQNYSFGDLTESAKVRTEVLKKLVPRLKIKDKCSFEGKFLVVAGKLRTYKIHMGSGNIQMKPNDQYLCIVASRGIAESGKDRLFLPFEGDTLLSIIISKALLLADDDKITDITITRQINS